MLVLMLNITTENDDINDSNNNIEYNDNDDDYSDIIDITFSLNWHVYYPPYPQQIFCKESDALYVKVILTI